MAFNPQLSSEDLLLGSDENPLYNNVVPHGERMCYGSDEEQSSGDDEVVGNQKLDYSQLERIIAGPERRSAGRVPMPSTGANQGTTFGRGRGRVRSVNGVRIFTAPPECTTAARGLGPAE